MHLHLKQQRQYGNRVQTKKKISASAKMGVISGCTVTQLLWLTIQLAGQPRRHGCCCTCQRRSPVMREHGRAQVK